MKTLIAMVFIFPLLAFAGIEDPMTTEGWLLQVLASAGTIKGMSALGLAALVTQLLMQGFKTPLASFTGKWRFVIVSGLSVVALVLSHMVLGLDLSAALAEGPVLAAVQVFLNQGWKQFFQKKD